MGFKVNDEYQNQLRKEVIDFMKWKGIEKHPYLNITVDKSEFKKATVKVEAVDEPSKTDKIDQNNNVQESQSIVEDQPQENEPQNQPEPQQNEPQNPVQNQPQNPPPQNNPAPADDEGFRIDWFDRIFYLIQMSFFGLMIFARTAMGSWWMFGAICIALIVIKLFVQGFFNPRRRQTPEQNAAAAAPADLNRPIPFGRVIVTFFTSFFRSLIPEALPPGVQFG